MFQLYALSSKDTNRCKNIFVSFPPSNGGVVANLCYGLYLSVAPPLPPFSLLIIAKVLYAGAIVVYHYAQHLAKNRSYSSANL